MGWERRNERSYYYRKRRVGEKVVSEYIGSGSVGEAAAVLDEAARLDRSQELEQLRRMKSEDRARDRQIDDLIASIDAAIRGELEEMGFHRHKRQWRRRMGESKTNALSTRQKYDWKAMLHDKVTLWDSGSITDVHDVLARNPEMWREHGDLIGLATANLIRSAWVREGERQSIEIGAKKLKEDLGYEFASPLERLSIDEVVISWIRMGEVQERHTRVQHSSNLTFSQSEYQEGLLLSAQRRYTRAIESLARVRKLLKGTAYVQINIAQDGGKQVNLFKIPDGRSPNVKPNIKQGLSSENPGDQMPACLRHRQPAQTEPELAPRE